MLLLVPRTSRNWGKISEIVLYLNLIKSLFVCLRNTGSEVHTQKFSLIAVFLLFQLQIQRHQGA